MGGDGEEGNTGEVSGEGHESVGVRGQSGGQDGSVERPVASGGGVDSRDREPWKTFG